MKISTIGYALSISAVAVLLAGCGGSQPPIGTPGAMPQSRAVATRAERSGSQPSTGTKGVSAQNYISQDPMPGNTAVPSRPVGPRQPGWFSPGTSGEGYLYIADEGNSQIDIFPLQGNQQSQVGAITDGIDTPYGLWDDANQALYVANQGNNTVTEYEYGATSPSRTYSLRLRRPLYPIVDNNGDLFVSNGRGGAVVEYILGTTKVRVLHTPGNEADGMAFDRQGNLYVAYRIGHNGSGSIEEFAPGGTQGQILGMTLDQPQGVIVDNSGDIVTVETGKANRIDVFPPGSQTPSLEEPMPYSNTPTELAIQSNEEYLYVSSTRTGIVYGATYPLPSDLFVKDETSATIQGVTITNNQAP
jgi:hypothetical protein